MRREEPRLFVPCRGTPDVERPWRTFSDLNREHGLTRGALDALVLSGAVPSCTGRDLFNALFDEEGFAEARQRDTAREAASRLGSLAADFPRAMSDAAFFLAEEEKRLGVSRDGMYYDFSAYLAKSAAAKLGAAVGDPEAELKKVTAIPGAQPFTNHASPLRRGRAGGDVPPRGTKLRDGDP